MNYAWVMKRLLTHPIYFVEFIFVGAPFFFAQVLVFGIGYITYKLSLTDGVGSFSFNAEIFALDFDLNAWFLLAPIGAAIVIKLLSLGLGKNIVLTWRHWFWSFATIDTLLYGLAFAYLYRQGVFQAANGDIGVALVLGLYGVTILFTFLHFYLYEKIGENR
ncbi:MAG: hypothetical protein COU11_03600 [Candidatus Harrisonbacteria bacterium CG10_big_fil_rev_8_21_14_0_10_49_15]|uniref:Uncharacterized protein n=1 Tax=Candidatus Harrisonbacteria bacterium CG10_big_fil_rev_8_21_14_0_10_49_15 TaxID=1974587 RepID=A0A2H0UKH9_9BACT|nr:MAG: hypothetical protein COU11_03600 [Candidatus Harrisonbacteria bacterium CG10_big_fil_rev_8_21_14_0_10_49_15]